MTFYQEDMVKSGFLDKLYNHLLNRRKNLNVLANEELICYLGIIDMFSDEKIICIKIGGIDYDTGESRGIYDIEII